MRRMHLLGAGSAAILLTTALSGTTLTSAVGSASSSTTSQARSYVVLTASGSATNATADRLRDSGATVTSVNSKVGMIVVSSHDAAFRADAAQVRGVEGVAANRSIGYVPQRKPVRVEREALDAARSGTAAPATPTPGGTSAGDPLDPNLWGMRMINADKAHAITRGSHGVKVGVIDTGVQGDHPDLAPNFDQKASRNFVTDIPEIDGPCEHAGCVDPVGEDDGGHGTHVAGTIAAALNNFGVSGVAPNVDLVEVRAGQDSGYFFLQPTVDALTYAGDAGIDVVNMSFYVDPWLYNCTSGAPEDTPEQAQDQATIIALMDRALDYAHSKGVTLVAATGNNHEDLSQPRHDFSSPDYGAPTHERTIDNASCFDLPVEGPHVIGVDALGPSARKSDFSNYTTDLTSGEVEVSAPGGWFRDGFGTSTYRSYTNEILSTVPEVSVQETGEVDQDGNVTDLGRADGVMKQCLPRPRRGSATCGYYAWYQGTSMASPHATGVAALAVSAHGTDTPSGMTMSPDAVRDLLMGTATDHACPEGGVQSYTAEGRSDEFTATCTGTPDYNGFYGAGIVNALGVVQ